VKISTPVAGAVRRAKKSASSSVSDDEGTAAELLVVGLYSR